MAFGALFLAFIIMTVISILGIAFLWLAKNQKATTVFFYGMAVWSMIIAYISATALPTNYVLQQVICWAIGFVGVIAIILRYAARFEKVELTAKVLVTVSVIGGMINLFF